MTDATGKLARWRLKLSEFKLGVLHRAGIKHEAADALSRLPATGNNETPSRDDDTILDITDDTASHDKWSVLKITHAKYC